MALIVVVLALGAASLPYLLRSRPERATGGVPEAIAPFGGAMRAGLTFRWTVPADDAPVRIELFDATRGTLWRSEPDASGALRPPASETARWPAGDLLWRPVAVPPGEPERAGDLAAFVLLP